MKKLSLTEKEPMWETIRKKAQKNWKKRSDYLFPKQNMQDWVVPEKNWFLCDDPLALFIAQSQIKYEQINAGFVDNAGFFEDPSEGNACAPQCDVYLGWCEGTGWFVMLSLFPLGDTFLYTEELLTEKWGADSKSTMMGVVKAPSLIPESNMDEMIDDLLDGEE